MSIQQELYGHLPDGRPIDRFTLTNANGLECQVITLGGIITELHVPDRRGQLGDVVLGLPSLEAYVKGHPCLGALIGRVAGRITGGSFVLDGVQYEMTLNQPPNHLHGGKVGFDKRVWDAESGETPEGEPFVKLSYHSADGEEKYPGNLDVDVIYTLTNQDELRIDYRATSDKATPFSPTQHTYFNLAGEGTPTIGGHQMQILSDTMVPQESDGTLSGIKTPVQGGLHDFRKSKSVAEFVAHECHGENYLIRDENADIPKCCAVVTEPNSGRIMEVLTTTTGLQFYTGKTLEEMNLKGKSGTPYPNFSGFCLECQGYPDSVNSPEIDDIILRPGQTYQQTTIYRFSAQ